MKSFGLLILSLAAFAALFAGVQATKYATYLNPDCLGPPNLFVEWDTIILNDAEHNCSLITANIPSPSFYVSATTTCTDGQTYGVNRYSSQYCNDSHPDPILTSVPGSCVLQASNERSTAFFDNSYQLVCDGELPVKPYVLLESDTCSPPAAPSEAPVEAPSQPTKRAFGGFRAVFNNSVAGTCQSYWSSDDNSISTNGAAVEFVMIDAVCESSFTGNLTINFYNTSDCAFFQRSETYLVSSDPCDNIQGPGVGMKVSCFVPPAPSAPTTPSAIQAPTSAAVSFAGVSIASILALLSVFVQ